MKSISSQYQVSIKSVSSQHQVSIKSASSQYQVSIKSVSSSDPRVNKLEENKLEIDNYLESKLLSR